MNASKSNKFKLEKVENAAARLQWDCDCNCDCEGKEENFDIRFSEKIALVAWGFKNCIQNTTASV